MPAVIPFIPLIAGGVAAGGSIAAGVMGKNAAENAANTQAEAANHAADLQLQGLRESNALQEKIYNQNRTDLAPYREAGETSLADLLKLTTGEGDFTKPFTMADFQADPGYDFRLSEAQKAIERSAAARGGLGSGATLKELTRFSQDYAGNEYQNAFNRFYTERANRLNPLYSLAGLGQSGVTGTVNAGTTYGNQAGQNAIYSGNAAANGINNAAAARASGYVGGTNQFTQGIAGGFNSLADLLKYLPNRGSNQEFGV